MDVWFPGAGGEKARGEVFEPEGRGPGLVVVHEWWGLNDDIRRIGRRFADEGFLVLALDAYGKPPTSDPAEAQAMANAMKTEDVLAAIAGAASLLRASPKCTGKVGVTGFCLGGALAISAAFHAPAVDAAVAFYGTPPDRLWTPARVPAPIQGHFGRKDPIIPESRVEQLAARAREAGGTFELHTYDAGHAFLREGDPSAYDAASAALAWPRALAFFRERLG